MQKKITRKDMLVNQKGFIETCEIVRNLVNKYYKDRTFNRFVKLDNKIANATLKHSCSMTTILECVGADRLVLRKGYEKFGIDDKLYHRKVYTLNDKMYYARMYHERGENETLNSVAKKAGVSRTLLLKWRNDYLEYGESMIARAVAFKRS